eukprot:7257798-Prymnesium_polylepis.1
MGRRDQGVESRSRELGSVCAGRAGAMTTADLCVAWASRCARPKCLLGSSLLATLLRRGLGGHHDSH